MHTHRHELSADRAATLLRQHRFRATPARITTLQVLAAAGKPLTIADLMAAWPGTPPNQATVYRIINDLYAARIINRFDLYSGVTHYEYTPTRPHHHHAVCTGCGLIEEIDNCSIPHTTLPTLRKIVTIDAHQLEYYGRCAVCARS